jgi:hypothetical protein
VMFTKEKIKPENSLLQKHKESTLEKNEAKRVARREMLNKQFNKIVKDPF